MEGKRVSTFWQLNDDRVVRSLRGVVLSEFRAQPSRLHPYQRVQVGIEIRRTTEYFGRNLVFLKGNTWVLNGLIGQISQ